MSEKSSLPSSPEPEVDYVNEDVESSEELAHMGRTVWRKLDRRLLPIAAMFYFLSFLDRSNISNARVAGLQTDLKMTNREYSIALTVTYAPYIAAELPSNLLLKIVGPDRMLPSMVALWGVVSTMQGVVHSYQGLLACRFFLGLIEGGLFPGLVYYLSSFYPRSMLNIRVSTFFASASLSGAFSGLLAAAITKMNGIGGRPGWAWIFILEGIFTVLFGLFSFLFVARSPTHAPFLDQREKDFLISKLKESGAVSYNAKDDEFSWREVGKAFLLPQVWILSVPLFFSGVSLFGLALFEPSIVQTFGFTTIRTQLMSVPPFAVSFVLSMMAAWVSDTYHCRGLVAIFASTLSLIGFSMFLGSDSLHVRYGSLFFSVPGAYMAAPTLSTWAANHAAPEIRRATAIAIAFISANSGGILSTWLLGTLSPAPEYTKATISFIVMSVVMGLFSGLNLWYLWSQNKKKAIIRKTMKREDEPRGLGDQSAWFVYNL